MGRHSDLALSPPRLLHDCSGEPRRPPENAPPRRPGRIVVARGRMKIMGRDLEQEFDARLVRRSLRIANTPRWLYLPGGGACVTSDNAAVDRITRERRYERVLHKWESRPAYAALAVALVAGMLWLLVDRGVPVAVERIAEHIPVEADAA